MKPFIKIVEKRVEEALKKCGYEDEVTLSVSSRPDLGQFQYNGVMGIAKRLRTNPIEIAKKIVEELNQDEYFTNVNMAGPGFINLSFNNEKLVEYVNLVKDNFDLLVDKKETKNVIVDYGGANAAKALHVGHMRSANIGEALKRLYRLVGHKVIGDVHLGDVGRQAGMVISELKLRHPDWIFFRDNYDGSNPKIDITPADLGEIYPCASNAAKENEERMEEVREITALIDKGYKPYVDLWKQIIEVSSEDIKQVYDILNCDFDLWEGEMDSYKYIDDTIKILNPYLYESEGALVMDVAKEDDKIEIPPLIVIKKDGSTIYATRDLATIYSRMERFSPDEICYVVDNRQGMYFKQVFRSSYKSGLVKESTELNFYGFGTMNGSDGKPFKTRDGGVMELRQLVSMVEDVTYTKLKETIVGDERRELAGKLAIAVLKYADLLPLRNTDYIFDVDKFSSLEGKTGPYILYTAVRINSIFSKLESKKDKYDIKGIYSDEELNIYLKLVELTKTIDAAFNEKTLSYICDYLFNLANLYNKFYSEHNILNEEDENKKETYLALSQLTYSVIEKLLNVLAIDMIDKM